MRRRFPISRRAACRRVITVSCLLVPYRG